MRSLRLLTVLSVFALGAAAQVPSAWVLRTDGIGPVKIGMSLPQLNAILHEHFSMPIDKGDQGCFYVTPRNHSQVSFMIEGGRLVRVDVNKEGVATVRGVYVGDTEAHVKGVYGSQLEIKPSQYSGESGGHYLTLRSPDQGYGIRFETEENRVVTFCAGKWEAVQYVEGCE